MNLYGLFGVLAIGISLVVAVKGILLTRRCSEKTIGKVISINVKTDMGANGRFRNCYVPVYEYYVDDVVYQAIAKEYSSNAGAFKLGTEGTVRYNPKKPGECVVNGKSGNLYITGFFLVVGIICFFFGH